MRIRAGQEPAQAPPDLEDGTRWVPEQREGKAYRWGLWCWNPLPKEKLEIKQRYFAKIPGIAKISHQTLIVPCTLD